MSEKNNQACELAQLQFTDQEIATILEESIQEIQVKYKKDIAKGRLLAEAEVRKAVFKAAKEGNTTAQKHFMTMNRRAKNRI